LGGGYFVNDPYVGWGDEGTPTVEVAHHHRWGSFVTPTYNGWVIFACPATLEKSMRWILAFVFLASAATTTLAATKGEVWSPEVKFSLESSNHIETLVWISGFSYALPYTSRVTREQGKSGIYCAPSSGHIGSKELLEILNGQFEGKRITSEMASTALLIGVRRRFPCG
jgi:hypothetical protein